jgi:hypothetical protein
MLKNPFFRSLETLPGFGDSRRLSSSVHDVPPGATESTGRQLQAE